MIAILGNTWVFDRPYAVTFILTAVPEDLIDCVFDNCLLLSSMLETLFEILV